MNIKEDEKGMRVKVRVVDNTLIIEGYEEKTDDDENDEKNNKWKTYLPDDEYKCEELKAVMKNGVLIVVVPKKKDEERKDVMVVQIVARLIGEERKSVARVAGL